MCSTEGMLEVEGLREFWESQIGGGPPRPPLLNDLLCDTLGLGNQQVLHKLFSERPSYPAFCEWIITTVGQPDPALLSRYHAWMRGDAMNDEAAAYLAEIAAMPPVLDDAALAYWDKHGYVVVPEAITAEQAKNVTDLLWSVVGASPNDPTSWSNADTNGIMIPHFQDPALTATRRSPRIHKAFSQLWGSENLWVRIDRMGFNPPLKTGGSFRASGIHFDVSLAQPIPFGTQAVLYLTDVAEDQGAFRCVPGFHKHIDQWLDDLGDTDPRSVAIPGEVKYVAAKAGELIIWQQDLPHAASPNLSDTPRLVQYMNYYSPDMTIHPEWR